MKDAYKTSVEFLKLFCSQTHNHTQIYKTVQVYLTYVIKLCDINIYKYIVRHVILRETVLRAQGGGKERNHGSEVRSGHVDYLIGTKAKTGVKQNACKGECLILPKTGAR